MPWERHGVITKGRTSRYGGYTTAHNHSRVKRKILKVTPHFGDKIQDKQKKQAKLSLRLGKTKCITYQRRTFGECYYSNAHPMCMLLFIIFHLYN